MGKKVEMPKGTTPGQGQISDVPRNTWIELVQVVVKVVGDILKK